MTAQSPRLNALAELQLRPQWVVWRKKERKNRLTKVPYNPRTRQVARSDDPKTWGSYEQAWACFNQHRACYHGIGYMFHHDITGVDLDHCIQEDDSIDAWAQDILTRMHSYSERSPSNTGIHILIRGTIPAGIRRRVPDAPHPDAAIEIYSSGRYFTMTGMHIYGTPATIEEQTEQLQKLYTEIANPKRKAPRFSTLPSSSRFLSPADEVILQKARAAPNGAKFTALWQGDISGYLSQSEAELALCILLAFWTGREATAIDRLFRSSSLYREKWDERRGQQTYGERTLAQAIAYCDTTYDPSRSEKRLEQQVEHSREAIEGRERISGKRRRYQLQPADISPENVLDYLAMNELGDALLFATCFEGQICYDVSEKGWYSWSGNFWEPCTPGKLMQIVAGYLGMVYLKARASLNINHAALNAKVQQAKNRAASEGDQEPLQAQYQTLSAQLKELEKRAMALRTAKRTRNILAYLEGDDRICIKGESWDTNPWLLACPNGVVDLRTGSCREGNPNDAIRTVCPTEWQGLELPCPRFEHFLQEIFAEKADRDILIAFLHRLLGYSITGLVTDHIFPILYGEEGRNGKDTLVGVLHDVLGPLAGAISNDVFIAANKGRTGGAATPHLCDLQGKRLVWGSETKQGDTFNVAQVKQLSGGGSVSARPLFGKQYTFQPTHKLVLMTNYKPHADAKDKAFWERVCFIEFALRFVDRPTAPNERQKDSRLSMKLKEEAPGILAWLVRGCLAWQEQGLNIPDSIKLATNKYRDEEDRLQLFIEDCCVIQPEATVQAGVLYSAYKAWCLGYQMRALNGKLFGEEIGKKFLKERKKQGWIYYGIGLLESQVAKEADV
ncbi:MAG TPA: phage/plasmid primase, P4 family [Ktedonobacteraceae bacterium]|nr:phage/plasmid primase, P4 family [Ktedonobacteraceae bacterium]